MIQAVRFPQPGYPNSPHRRRTLPPERVQEPTEVYEAEVEVPAACPRRLEQPAEPRLWRSLWTKDGEVCLVFNDRYPERVYRLGTRRPKLRAGRVRSLVSPAHGAQVFCVHEDERGTRLRCLGDRARLDTGSLQPQEVACPPGGEVLVFSTLEAGIHQMSLTRGRPERLFPGELRYPTFSPDGHRMAFVAGGARLKEQDRTTGQVREVYAGQNLGAAAYSAEGGQLLFVESGGLHCIDCDGGCASLIVEGDFRSLAVGPGKGGLYSQAVMMEPGLPRRRIRRLGRNFVSVDGIVLRLRDTA